MTPRVFLPPALLAVTVASSLASMQIEIDLSKQRAQLLRDGEVVHEAPISSGRSSHPTPPGEFSVSEKDADHRSTLYGKIVNAIGKVVKADASSKTPVPEGCRFDQAPMPHFLRFNGAVGMHAGRLPGYAASHGCIRLPAGKAAAFFAAADLGTPVKVFGEAPARKGVSAPAKEAPEAVPAPLLQRFWLFRVFDRQRSASLSRR